MKKIAILIVLLSITVMSCKVSRMVYNTGNGNIIEKEIKLTGFEILKLENMGDVFIKLGDEEKIIVQTDSDLFHSLKSEVKAGALVLGTKANILPTKLTYYITMKELDGLQINGSGDIKVQDFVKNDDIGIQINGSGDIRIDSIEVFTTDISINGSGDIKLAGKSEKVNIDISGSGDVFAKRLYTDISNISINGSGDVKIHAEKELYIKINGSGDVFYSGDPKDVKTVKRGSGNIRQYKDKQIN